MWLQTAFAIAAPFLLGFLWWRLWVYYVNGSWLLSLKWVMLEVKLPPETNKSPAAMEIVLKSLYQTGGVDYAYERYWKGNLVNFFSLEIVSIGGEMHFFIRTIPKFRNMIEADIYGQYPGAEIFEVEDYVLRYPPYKNEKVSGYGIFFREFKLGAEDWMPIRTYVDYGLDKDPKEEYKIDPLSSMIEYMGSLKAHEEMWVQILVRGTTSSWKDDGRAEINKIMGRDKEGKPLDPEKKVNNETLTLLEKERIKAIERNIAKLGFDVGIRTCCLANLKNGEKFDPNHISGMANMWRQYSGNHLNSFKHSSASGFDLPWQDYKNRRANYLREKAFGFFKLRSFFYPPYAHSPLHFSLPGELTEDARGKPFVLNQEELATIYHFPGSVVGTPTFSRIDSKKAEPPANLPI